MEQKEIQDILLQLLASELNRRELAAAVIDKLTPEVTAELYSLSKRHDLAHILSASLYRYGALATAELLSKFNREELKSVYRHEQMNYAYEQICSSFENANIKYIPLKGSVIRPYYPKASMRTSCDIDILVREEDLTSAVDVLTEIGYKVAGKNYHDISLFSPNKIHLELHFSILENIPKIDSVLGEAWQYAVHKEGCRYEFTPEFLLFHMFAHMSYHFLSGGCGLRSLMDIWVMEHRMKISYKSCGGLLNRGGIYRFASEISSLANKCFSPRTETLATDPLLAYILYGGVYGVMENGIAINEARSHVTLGYAFRRVFVPYRDIAIEYTSVRRFPPLCIPCWFHRTFKLGIGLLKRMIRRRKIANSITDDEYSHAVMLRHRLGL